VQTVVQVICSKGPSLRSRIERSDMELKEYFLQVVRQKDPKRSPGWAKIKSTRSGTRGALNIYWHPPTQTLVGRVVTRRAGKPNRLVGDFVSYLLAIHNRRIRFMYIQRL
jgi:hypothetical protein